MDKFTKEQEVEIKKLRKSAIISGIKFFLKLFLYLIISTTVVELINHFYVHSVYFGGIGGFISGIFIFKDLAQAMRAEDDHISLEVLRILTMHDQPVVEDTVEEEEND